MNPEDYSDYFATTFRNFCIKAAARNDLKAPQIARVTGLSKSYVNKILNTKVPAPQPTMATMALLCSVFGFDTAKVMHSIIKHMPVDPVEDLRIRPEGWVSPNASTHKAMEKPRVRAPIEPSEPIEKPISDEEGFALIDSAEI